MTDISITAATAAEADAAQLWNKELNREAPYLSWWSKFMGEGPNNVIQVKKDFKKNKGDAMNFGLVADSSQVIHAEGWHEGNEESLTTYWDSVSLDEFGNAHRANGKLSEQRASWDMREECRTSAKRWIAQQTDKLIFYKMSGQNYTAYPGTSSGTLGSLETAFGTATTNTNILYAGDAEATGDIEEADVFTLDLINDAKTCAETGVLGSTTNYRMNPILYNGGQYFICVIHPYAKNDLKKSADYKSLMKEAEVRGRENPLFSGADFYYDGVWIYTNWQVYTASTWGSSGNVSGAYNLFLGAQAGLWADAQEGWSTNEELFDYGRKWGVSWDRICGFDKATFNSIDFATIAILTACKNPKL